jgi:hypothetical protein
VDEKVLARVRGLLAKAESTTFPDEAEALSAKAQELMTRHAFDRALVDSAPQSQSATARRIWLDNPYASAKVLLVQSVAKANRCRTMYYSNLGFVTVLGNEVDLRIVELLSTSLLVQATKAMVAKGSQISHSGQSRTRSYRQAFLVAYANRIGERLRGVSEASVAAESEPGRLLPVLAARSKAVDDLFVEMFPRTVSKPVSVTNAAGWAAGRAAADAAVLSSGQRIGKATSQTSSAGFAAMKSVK